MSLQVLSLCSGIGGFELAAEMVNNQLGFEAFQLKALCEKNKFCRDRALKYNFPNVPIYEDIRDIATQLGDYDLIVGGLPCQPFSQAGKQKGEADDRNLFPEFFRILRGVRPRGAIIENVPGLLTIDSGRVFASILWEYTKAGYSVEWNIVSCAEMGGVHKRERLWIVAYSNSIGRQPSEARSIQDYKERDLQILGQGWQPELYEAVSSDATSLDRSSVGLATNANSIRCNDGANHREERHIQNDDNGRTTEGQPTRDGRVDRAWEVGAIIADSDQQRFQQREGCAKSKRRKKSDWSTAADTNGVQCTQRERLSARSQRECLPNPVGGYGCSKFAEFNGRQKEETQSRLCCGNDGLPSRMVRSHLMTPDELPEWLPHATDDEDKPFRKEMLQALGNAIVPDVAAIALMRFLELIEMKTEIHMEQVAS